MRDFGRIQETMDLITLIWKKEGYQDLRFNQLIDSLQNEFDVDRNYRHEFWEKDELENITAYRKVNVIDLFNVEDDVFIKFLVKKVKSIK